MKKFIKLIKRNLISCICVLLAVAVCLTGTFSYARYISVDSSDHAPGAGKFSYSANIDSVSALSFTNTAFWGGTSEEDKIAMNALRSIDFNVKNYETKGGVEEVAEVKMKYNLVFSAPVNFAERLAIQVFDSDAGIALLPQIVISDLIGASGGVFNTGDSEDYNGTDIGDMSFNVQALTSGENHIYRATNGDISISIEEFVRDVHQTLLFRMWDTSAITDVNTPTLSNEGGKLLPPLSVKYKQDVNFYRITISMPNFVLEPGTKKARNHRIELAPTDTIQDDHLGGEIVKKEGDTYSAVKSIYADNQTWTVQTVHESETDHYLNTDFDTYDAASDAQKEDYCDREEVFEYNVMGSPRIYNDEPGENIINSAPVTYQSKVEDNEPKDWTTTTTTTEKLLQTTSSSVDTDGLPTWNSSNTYTTITIPDVGSRRVYLYTFNETKRENIEITTVETKKRVLSSVTTTNKDVSETIEVKSVSAGQQNIELNVTKTTKTKTSVVNNVEKQVITTITTVRRNSNRTYYKAFYRANPGTGNNNASHRPNSDDHVEYLANSISVSGRDYPLNKMDWNYTDTTTQGPTENDTGIYPDTETSSTSNEITELVKRYINRSFNHSDIIIEGVEWAQRDDLGNPLYIDGVLQVNNYTESNPLELYRQETEGSVTKDVQHYYLAKCYSKNYPFYVNVIFEQIQ